MRVDEFIKNVNKIAFAKQEEQCICIYARKRIFEADSSDWFIKLCPKSQALVYNYDWTSLKFFIDTIDLFYILNQIHELKNTPVKDRFSEKKYQLRWMNDSDGCANYLSDPDSWGFTSDEADAEVFTESEIERLKCDNPHLSQAIDAMKEEAKDDE